MPRPTKAQIVILVRAELWPGGDESRCKVVGTLILENITGTADVSSYSVCLDQTGDDASGSPEIDAVFQLHGHRRSDGLWKLVQKAVSCLDLELLNSTRDTNLDP